MADAKDKRFDVVVIGAGITGLSAALHLESRNVARIALSSSTKAQGATRLAAGLGTAGFIDNFTRFSHHFGETAAAEAWRFAAQAQTAFLAGCERLQVPVATGRHVRLATAEDELAEARRAVEELTRQGFGARLQDGGGQALAIGALPLTKRVLALQEDDSEGEPHGLAVDPAELLRKLDAAVRAPRLHEVTRLRHEAAGLVLEHADGSETRTEVVICAAHLATAKLVPEIASALVSVADQWTRVRFDQPGAFPPELVGTVFSAKHGHEWGGFVSPTDLVLGGARYLRRWAGIEAKVASTEPRISEHLLKLAMQTFAFVSGPPKIVGAEGFLDCRPCDELPIVGPMFGEGRILVATGFLGAGLTLGWLAGDCLAELVTTGECERLPRRYWPERLRSLEN